MTNLMYPEVFKKKINTKSIKRIREKETIEFLEINHVANHYDEIIDEVNKLKIKKKDVKNYIIEKKNEYNFSSFNKKYNNLIDRLRNLEIEKKRINLVEKKIGQDYLQLVYYMFLCNNILKYYKKSIKSIRSELKNNKYQSKDDNSILKKDSEIISHNNSSSEDSYISNSDEEDENDDEKEDDNNNDEKKKERYDEKEEKNYEEYKRNKGENSDYDEINDVKNECAVCGNLCVDPIKLMCCFSNFCRRHLEESICINLTKCPKCYACVTKSDIYNQ